LRVTSRGLGDVYKRQPGTSTQTVGIYIYKTAFIFGDFGLAASASVVLVLLLAPFMPSIIKQFNLNQGGGK
jgi:multiple sugar transport system permease protein